ncbi:hypothetical protein [Mycobacterium sp. 236(2023)]|uniref:hypothetical protein n=1 Tax=Mycobacterium sp. 236(2023) TaxID=3038163 RepID=UPI0024157A5F|nr:hypothetical protein [Mycobacterium sp. 236(2023)]MDG4668648.1 hypothetical protein [Mycobacterium sp. 236(2023)]
MAAHRHQNVSEIGRRIAAAALLAASGAAVALVCGTGVALAENEQNVQRGSEIGIVNAGPSEVRSSDVGLLLAGAAEAQAGETNQAWSSIGDERSNPFSEPGTCAEIWDPANVSTAAVGGGLNIPGVFFGGC